MSDDGVFSEWFPLTAAGTAEHAPIGPAAVQLRRAEGLVSYPTGKSAMVFYFYAEQSVAEALASAFEDELAAAGVRGQGPLWFRVLEGTLARSTLTDLFDEFEARFGAAPVLHT